MLGVIGFVLGEEATAFQILSIIIKIAVFISGLAVGAKRLHDRDKSGWWLLLFYIVPSVLLGLGMAIAIIGAAGSSGGTGMLGLLLILAGPAVAIWAIVELGCLRGTVGPNQYGPDPLAGQ